VGASGAPLLVAFGGLPAAVTRNHKAGPAEVLSSPWFTPAVLLAALALRVAWALLAGDVQRFSDSDSYIKIADNVLAGNGFLWGDQFVGRPPLYPLLVAATRFHIFGHEFLALYLVQALLSTVTIALFAASARRMLGPIAASVTAVIVALDPYLVFHVGTVLSETLFTFFLATFFYGFVTMAGVVPTGTRATRRDEFTKRASGMTAFLLPGAAIAGLAAGASFLTRPSLMWLVVAFAVLVVAWARPFTRAVVSAAAMLVLAFLVVLPWGIRNHRATGHWIWTTLGVGASLYDGLGPQANGSSDMSFLHEMPRAAGESEYDYDARLREKALEAARADSRRVLRLAAVKVGRFWSPVPNNPQFAGGFVSAVSAAAVIPVYLLALLALVNRVVRGRWLLAILATPLYFTMLHAIFIGSARYRTPVMPFVAMLAAAAAAWMVSPGSEARKRYA
jgi:4-amino-4-deoxy-L-arabinose transferase-like glycosyltransferase